MSMLGTQTTRNTSTTICYREQLANQSLKISCQSTISTTILQCSSSVPWVLNSHPTFSPKTKQLVANRLASWKWQPSTSNTLPLRTKIKTPSKPWTEWKILSKSKTFRQKCFHRPWNIQIGKQSKSSTTNFIKTWPFQWLVSSLWP